MTGPAPEQAIAPPPASQPPAPDGPTEAMPGRDHQMRLGDGRRISYRTFGVAGGRPMLALHGTPGSRLKFTATDDVAHRLGLEIVAPDRWGYGDSDPHPAPTLQAFADDMATLMTARGAQHFAVMGVSGGGPYAAAVAASLGRRVAALALVAPVGPIAGEADTEIGAFHRFCFGPFARSAFATRLVFGGFRRLLLARPSLGLRVAMARVPPADRDVLAAPGVAQRLADTFVEGLRPGVDGPATDMQLFGRPWGPSLDDARCPARLWIGTDDRNVPLSAAHRLAQRLAGCEVVEISGAGHLWVAQNYAVVLAWMAAQQT